MFHLSLFVAKSKQEIQYGVERYSRNNTKQANKNNTTQIVD